MTESDPLDKMFRGLAAGQVPNCLELMSAISYISTLYPGCQDC